MKGNTSSASAPGKIILFGEHFVVYGIPALLAAINKRTTVQVKARSDGFVRLSSDIGVSAKYGESGVKSIIGGKQTLEILDPIYAAAKSAHASNAVDKGLEVKIKSQIPYGIGLGSSAASCVATVAAVDSMGAGHDRDWICGKAIEAERIIHKNSSGADCYVSTFGGIMRYSKLDGYCSIQPKRPLYFVLGSTGVRHSTGEMVEKVRKFRDASPSVFKSIGNHANLICTVAVTALESGDHAKVGNLMNENQALLEKIGVSHARAEKIIKVILDSGAHGAKITGAGGGGAVIGLVPSAVEGSRIAKRLRQFGFESAGIKVDLDGLIVKKA